MTWGKYNQIGGKIWGAGRWGMAEII